MAGIRVDTPQGTGWEYSLDNNIWQTSRIFATMPGGTPFVAGQAYVVNCRNISLDVTTKATIFFGESSNDQPIGLDNANDGDIITVKVINGERFFTVTTVNALTASILAKIAVSYELRSLFCSLADSCVTAPPQINFPPTFSDFEHFEFLPNVQLPALYTVRLDENSCGANGTPGSIAGWVFDENHKTTAPFVRIMRDGEFAADITATVDRPDVLAYLKNLGKVPGNQTFCRWGYGYTKPINSNTGLPIHWEVFGGTSTTKAISDVGAVETTTCGAPTPLSGPTNYRRKEGAPLSVTEGGIGIQLGLERRWSDGSWREVSGLLITWSNVDAPAGVGVDSSGFFSAGANTISANTSVEVHAAVDNGGNDAVSIAFTVQVLNADCQRPGGLTTYILAWNYVPAGGYARLFTTLTDANNTVGAKLDNSAQGIISTFGVAMATVAVGQTVYNGVSLSCEVVDDKIYYVFANGQVDSIKKAIRVQDGVITEVLASTYSTSTCPSGNRLTSAQYNALTQTWIFELAETNINPYDGSTRQVRPFATRDEALYNLSRDSSHNSRANAASGYRCSSPSVELGALLYSFQRVESSTNLYYPVEAGYWGFNQTLPTSAATGSVVLIKTNACGVVIGREVVAFPVIAPPNPNDFTYWNDFSFNFFDEDGLPSPGFSKIRGTWSWVSGKLRQTSTTTEDTAPMLYTQNGSANGLNVNQCLVRIKPTALALNYSYMGAGIRMGSTGDFGYSALINNSNTFVLIRNGFGYGPSLPFDLQTGMNYWIRLKYQETGSSTATISARIWAEGAIEPSIWMLTWEGQARLMGYPAMFGGSNGATADFDDFAYLAS